MNGNCKTNDTAHPGLNSESDISAIKSRHHTLNWHEKDKRALCACVCAHLCSLYAGLVLQMKLCMNTLISAPFGWSGAWLWISILHSSLVATPGGPTWHKSESDFCLCQRLPRSGVQLKKKGASFTQPPYHKGINRLCCMNCRKVYRTNVCSSCLRQQNIYFILSLSQSSCECQPQRSHMSCEAKWCDKSPVQ